MLGLRKINEAEYQLRRALHIWQARGIDVKEGGHDETAKWISVRDVNHCWKGWIQTRELIATSGVCAGHLALTSEVEALIIEWMNHIGSLPGLEVEELTTSTLVFGDRRESRPDDAVLMVRIQTSGFALWLEELNIKFVSPGTDAVHTGLKWQVDYILGHTPIRLETLDNISVSDLLLIRNVRSYASCFDKKLFWWSYPEGIMTSIDDEISGSTENAEGYACNVTNHELMDLKKIPVKLEFVLHSEVLTIEDLVGITSGQIHSFPESVEKRIEIRANGMRVGEGELVEYNGRLAVEVQQWMGGDNVE